MKNQGGGGGGKDLTVILNNFSRLLSASHRADADPGRISASRGRSCWGRPQQQHRLLVLRRGRTRDGGR